MRQNLIFGLEGINKLRDISTKFPYNIDDRIFWQDINLSQIQIIQNYYTYLNTGDYDKASELLNNSEVFSYGAWILNLLENRLYAMENYLMNEEKPKLVIYQSSEPINPTQGLTWID